MTGISRLEFDTTASKTGLKNSALSFIDNSGKQELAWVASLTCRHHVMELPLAAVFSILFGPTGGLMLPCSGGASKPGQVLTSQHNEVTSDDMFDSHTWALQEQMVQLCK